MSDKKIWIKAIETPRLIIEAGCYEANAYEAYAKDDDGNSYSIKWDIIKPENLNIGFLNCCDIASPREIIYRGISIGTSKYFPNGTQKFMVGSDVKCFVEVDMTIVG